MYWESESAVRLDSPTANPHNGKRLGTRFRSTGGHLCYPRGVERGDDVDIVRERDRRHTGRPVSRPSLLHIQLFLLFEYDPKLTKIN